MEYIILIISLAGIVFGADFLVAGAVSIARRYKVSDFVIGAAIVGVGTSMPELVVSFIGALNGNANVAIGNVVGSNIFNTAMILGVTALISPLVITKSNMKKDIPLNIMVTVLLIVLGMNFTLTGLGKDQLSRIDGLILIGIFAWYLWSSFRSDSVSDDEEEPIKQHSIAVSTLMIAGGLGGLIFGGRLFVNSATEIARLFGGSDKFIAITVMAAGTSMPELATCVVAALKGRGQLALGNILGSNISNILLILGGSAIIAPLSFTGMTLVDLGTVLAASLFILLSAWCFKKNRLDRIEGAILLMIEIGYMWYLISSINQ